MTQSLREFDDRLRRIERNRKGTGRLGGMKFEVDRNGRARGPVRGKRRVLGPVLRVVCYLVVTLYILKILAFASLGAAEYEHRGAMLSQGSAWERFVAVLMDPDPVVEFSAGQIRPFLSSL